MEWIVAHKWQIAGGVGLWIAVTAIAIRWWAKACHAEYQQEVSDRFGSADRYFNRDELTDREGEFDPHLSDALNELVEAGSVEQVRIAPGHTMYRRKRAPVESEAA